MVGGALVFSFPDYCAEQCGGLGRDYPAEFSVTRVLAAWRSRSINSHIKVCVLT